MLLRVTSENYGILGQVRRTFKAQPKYIVYFSTKCYTLVLMFDLSASSRQFMLHGRESQIAKISLIEKYFIHFVQADCRSAVSIDIVFVCGRNFLDIG